MKKIAQSLSFLKGGMQFGELLSSRCPPKKKNSQVLLSVACYRCELSIIRRMAKKKLKKNITGLRNQSKPASHVEEAPNDSTEVIEARPTHADMDQPSDNDEGWDVHVRLDSNKLCWEPEVDDEGENSEGESIDKEEGNVEDEIIAAGENEWRNDGLHAIQIGDDPRDKDWIPDNLRRKHNARIAQSKFVTKRKADIKI